METPKLSGIRKSLFYVDNGSFMGKPTNIIKENTEVMLVDNNNKVGHKLTAKKISTCLCFVNIRQGKLTT